MIRRSLLITALALVATAAFAGSAQASLFHVESSKGATITGAFPSGERAEGEQGFLFTMNAGQTLCLKTSLHGSLPEGGTAESLAISGEIFECAPFATVTMGKCQFVLRSSGTLEIGGGSECSIEPIEIQRGASCLIKIGPQQNLAKVTYANGGSGSERDITATVKVTGMHYIQIGGFCTGGSGTWLNGELSVTLTLKADTLGGSKQGLWFE